MTQAAMRWGMCYCSTSYRVQVQVQAWRPKVHALLHACARQGTPTQSGSRVETYDRQCSDLNADCNCRVGQAVYGPRRWAR
eukprot:scaffold7477_cov112-Isochrysis_galbana.AAC.2